MKSWITWLLFLIAFIYNILDAYQTKLLLNLGAKELNPIVNFFITVYGINSLYFIKITLFLFLGTFLLYHQYKVTSC